MPTVELSAASPGRRGRRPGRRTRAAARRTAGRRPRAPRARKGSARSRGGSRCSADPRRPRRAPRRSGAAARAGRARRRARAKRKAAKLNALSANTAPTPNQTIARPASAGPMKRAELNTMLLIATAVARCGRGTRLGTSASRAGCSTPAGDAADQHQRQQQRHGDLAARGQQEQGRRLDQAHHLRDLDQPEPVEAVGERAAERADQHGREQVGERRETEHRARVAELPGEPADPDPLHPGADQRDAVAGDVDAELAVRERARDRAEARRACSCARAPCADRDRRAGRQRWARAPTPRSAGLRARLEHGIVRRAGEPAASLAEEGSKQHHATQSGARPGSAPAETTFGPSLVYDSPDLAEQVAHLGSTGSGSTGSTASSPRRR